MNRRLLALLLAAVHGVDDLEIAQSVVVLSADLGEDLFDRIDLGGDMQVIAPAPVVGMRLYFECHVQVTR